MKKIIYVLVPLVVVSGIVFANRQIKNEPPEKSTAKPLPATKPIPATDQADAVKVWEATPEGMRYKAWEESPAGIKVLAGAAKIRNQVSSLADMKGVITSLTLPPNTRLGFALMVKVDGVDYIATFDTEKDQLEKLRSLQANDEIIIKGRGVSMAPKYAYPILSIESVKRNGKLVYKRVPPKGGC